MSRDLTRWLAICPDEISKVCGWDERKDPIRHAKEEDAIKESREHILLQHFSPAAREVIVRRTYAPRKVISETVVE